MLRAGKERSLCKYLLTVGKICLQIFQYLTFSQKESQGITWALCAGEAFPAIGVSCISLMQLLGLETHLMSQSRESSWPHGVGWVMQVTLQRPHR